MMKKASEKIVELAHNANPNDRGIAKEEAKKAGFRHDLFNLIYLPIIVGCILMNLDFGSTDPGISEFWYAGTDTSFLIMWCVTVVYFITDLIWVLVDKQCVKSPSVIVSHHIGTMLYLLLPLTIKECRWIMCVLLSVEVNTFFLMARRNFNTDKKEPCAEGTPFYISAGHYFILVCFHTSWIFMRCIIYPLFLPLLIKFYIDYSQEPGRNFFNIVLITPIIQCFFIYLNFTWTRDLYCPKVKPKDANYL